MVLHFAYFNPGNGVDTMMRQSKLAERIWQKWQAYTIKKKIMTFTAVVFLIILLSILFNILIVKYSMVDFNNILNENYKCNHFVHSIEKETELFRKYTKNPEEETKLLLEKAMEDTNEAVYNLTFEYRQLGELRYAYTWAVRSSYEIYVKNRDLFLNCLENQDNYIEKLYEIYDMQSYLEKYGNALMDETIAASSTVYREKVSTLIILPGIVLFFGILLMVCMAGVAKAMNRAIVVPVMKLMDTSKKIAANEFLIEDIEVENKDELGELVQAFNKMKYATREYIVAMEEKRATLDMLHNEEVQRLEAERRSETMRLEALKNQINPHFLFNTLNVIGGMAMLENAETTGQMIKALSSLFRYNLQSSETETSLARELNILRDYMYIQKMRFGDRIDYEIECLVDEEKTMVPTFILQPLAENAVIHGLAHKEEGGKIDICIRESEEKLIICVKDTGVGINKENLKAIKEKLEEDYSFSNIGLGNIYRRIKLAYPGSSMDIQSIENRGTLIEIVIPK